MPSHPMVEGSIPATVAVTVREIWRILIWRILIWQILIWRILIWRILIWRILIWQILIWRILIWQILIRQISRTVFVVFAFVRSKEKIK
jgi:hypothetical protein